MKVIAITNTCYACPAQWEGKFEDGSDLYIRYRFGCLRVEKDGEIIFHQNVGDGMDGFMSYDELKSIVRGIQFPAEESVEETS